MLTVADSFDHFNRSDQLFYFKFVKLEKNGSINCFKIH